jgi:uncharacterized membrane protein YkgB
MNGTTTEINQQNPTYKIGYYISLFGASLILLWIGIFKFTPTEAAAIKPLVENHFLTSVVYDVMSEILEQYPFVMKMMPEFFQLINNKLLSKDLNE